MERKVEKFIETLEDYGEMYFSSGDYEEDYKQISSVIKSQGYYSGNAYRFYFNKDFDLIKVERRF